ncbi:ABC transporter substrate-binding protein [Nocardioides cheoyonin]|uniref:ABC transporter substrate-binding protein n=1 Tax=Nocardioides cheoyonin TaxID=3156615 RepID=UPI0032B4D38E
MRRSKPLAAIAGVALFALAACGSGGGSDESPSGNDTFGVQKDVKDKDPSAKGPAPEVEGAQKGGTITVYDPGDPGPPDLDPDNGWSVVGNSIEQALLTRSLTQYRRDPETGKMILVPDLATDLGTPNKDYTAWTFTIKDGVKWENGKPVTAKEVAFGIARSMDTENFPMGVGQAYSQTYFKDAGKYKGPYSDKKTSWEKWGGVTVKGNSLTIHMSQTFPDMDFYAAFMAIGPVPLNAGPASEYGKHPLATGPYKIQSFDPEKQLVLVKNPEWDPKTDPARHQYADKWIIKFDTDQDKTDQIMLSNSGAGDTSLSFSINTSANLDKFKSTLGDRLIQQSSQCTSFWMPDYTKIKDINVRKAIAYGYPYADAWLAAGEVPNVTRVPANTIMPPGMAGKDEDFQVDGKQITYDPAKAKELLDKAGYAPGEYKLYAAYYEPDPLAVATMKQVKKGLEQAGFDVTYYPIQDSPSTVYGDANNKVNKKLNIRAVGWCSDWPSALTFIPPLLQTGQYYNFEKFSEKAVDDQIKKIPSMPLEDQPDAWGDLDKKIMTDYFPVIPLSYNNYLFPMGKKIGGYSGDGEIAAPNFKDLYVTK